jgi:hypothetical protein
MRKSFIALLACGVLSAAAAAQTEKVQLRLVPAPDQSVRFRMATEFTMGPAAGTDAQGPGVLPQVTMAMNMAFTQTTGHPDEGGRVKAEMTWDEANGSMTMDGKTTPIDTMSSFLGRQMTAVYDSTGKLVDLQAPPEMAAMFEPIKQMMTSMFPGMPEAPFGVGDTASVPLHFALPTQGIGGAPAMNGKSTFTLRSISNEGSERIAHFDQTIEAATQAANDSASSPMAVQFQMKATGTMDYNVDRGIVVANESHGTMDMKTQFAGDHPKGLPNLDMHGTMKMTLAATY